MPLTLHFIADALTNLMPVISVNLDHPSLASGVLSILEAIRATPYKLAPKIIYFKCLQSVIVFAPKLEPQLSPVRFPEKRPMPLKRLPAAQSQHF
jgi:hypothetical protein